MNLRIPVAMQKGEAAAQAPAEHTAMPHRILIIEDGRVLAKNMKTYLSRASCEVRTATDAAQAFEMLNSFAPDVLILDYGLPDVDGLRTYAEIVRRQARKIEGVMITGDSSAQLAQDAHALGIHHVICKPFRISDLARLLETPAASAAGDTPERNN
jgi:CheY-like chemotaxis protein